MAKASRDKCGTKVPVSYVKQYVHKLRKQSAALQKRWLEGDWNIEEKPINGKNGTR